MLFKWYEIRNFKRKKLITKTLNMQGRFKTSVKKENPTIFKKLIFQKFSHAIYLNSSPWQLKIFFFYSLDLLFLYF